MKKQQFHLYLNDDEYRKVLQALIALKNNLIEQGRYTDAVDDVLIKFTNSAVRKYIAQRADLLGAIRLPNNTFKGNAGTEVVSDILILQKRDKGGYEIE